MARRPDPRKEDVLTETELKDLQRRLAVLSLQHVEDFYNQAHRECCLREMSLPSPRAIQQLVQGWKQRAVCGPTSPLLSIHTTGVQSREIRRSSRDLLP